MLEARNQEMQNWVDALYHKAPKSVTRLDLHYALLAVLDTYQPTKRVAQTVLTMAYRTYAGNGPGGMIE